MANWNIRLRRMNSEKYDEYKNLTSLEMLEAVRVNLLHLDGWTRAATPLYDLIELTVIKEEGMN